MSQTLSLDGFEYIRRTVGSGWTELYSSIAPWKALVEHELRRGNVADAPQLVCSELYREISRSVCFQNLNLVGARTESPIERMFLIQLVMAFWAKDPLSLIVADSDWLRERICAKKVSRILLKMQRDGLDGWDQVLATLHPDVLGRHDHALHSLLYGPLNCDESVHLLIQPWIVDLPAELEPRTIDDGHAQRIARMRVDMLLWRPCVPEQRLIVECDGYRYHKDKFTEDRQRDRYLRLAGFDVLRFSGTEIMRNPVRCALELLDHVGVQGKCRGWGHNRSTDWY